MIHFDTDYMAGAHPKVMERLMQTNAEQTVGYGCDQYTLKAKELVKKACEAPDARVYFLVGGTQTNSTVIDGVLERHEGVLAAESGHINVHESGAIEATGHKVLTLPSYCGKVKAEDVRNYISNFYSDDTYEHMVAPGMLYISFPTEYGTLYSLEELEDCRALGFSGIHILSDKVLDLMEEYARSRDLPVDDPTGVKFSIMNFYLWAASKYPIYGVVAKDLNFLDVGKLDALAPAEEFVKNM